MFCLNEQKPGSARSAVLAHGLSDADFATVPRERGDGWLTGHGTWSLASGMAQRIPQAARDRVPDGLVIVRTERMSRAFTKYHLDDGRALHRFRLEEPHANPHDHPWPFDTQILDGGYIEEVFYHHHGGGWHNELLHRLPGDSYRIEAVHIHRIVALPMGECWTLVRAGRHERETRFWRFGEVVTSRAWHERRWVRHG